jgi:pimeloyl-ACP methyl ester carboxylesterase
MIAGGNMPRSLWSRAACAAVVAVSLAGSEELVRAAGADDPLPRRAWLGAALEPADGGVRVREVLPGSSAEAAELKPGDVIKSIDGQAVEGVPAVLRALRPLKGGAEAKVEIHRDGEDRSIALPLKEWPREPESDRYAVEYGAVASSSGLLRTIAMVPKARPDSGKFPALLIIQGLGAASLDNPRPGEPIDQPTGMACYRTIAATLADAGYLTFRVDKPGCGDSQGDAPLVDFQAELDGYRQALKALRARPDVDPDQIYVFGHSMGGVFGPMLAAETPVRGLAVYGTLIKTWLEYMLENERRQATLAGTDLAEFDRYARLSERFQHEFLVRKRAPDEILKEQSDLESVRENMNLDPTGTTLYGRHYTFFQQLSDVNLPEHWSKTDAHVLALWGAAEFVTARQDHEWIAAIVNRAHPGQGAFQEVRDSDHGFNRAATPEEAMQAGPAGGSRFNPEILNILRAWLDECRREDG